MLLLAGALLAPLGAQAQAPFFASDSVLAFTIRTDLRVLRRDRDTAQSPWRPATLSWTGSEGPRTVSLQVRTRGAFRLRHCDLPPLRLRFSQDSVRGTVWHDLHRPKLATHCKDTRPYEQNLLHEYALNRLFRVFTPLSYSVRLVRVTYEDASGSSRSVTRYGFVSEDPEEFARRVHGEPVERAGIRQSQLQSDNAALVGLWQYFIANTDWSVPGLHNVELLRIDSVIHAVAYDFDWAGAIEAPYATPDPRLPIRSVRQRLFRGLCLSVAQLDPLAARFEALRDTIRAVYLGVPDLDRGTIDRTMGWYGDFYRDLANRPRFVQNAIQPTCFRT